VTREPAWEPFQPRIAEHGIWDEILKPSGVSAGPIHQPRRELG